MTAELEELCQACGFCCDGTLFQKALLRPEEVPTAKRLGLHVIQDKGIAQPCPALTEAGCGVYAERPSVCQSFICKLYARHRDEGGPLRPRLRKVERAKQLLAVMKQGGMKRSEDGSELTFEGEGMDGFAMMAAFSELMELLEHDFARAVPAVRGGPDPACTPAP